MKGLVIFHKERIKLYKTLFSARTITSETVGDQFLISPITGEKIPADKVHQHMKIGMLFVLYNYFFFIGT